MWLGIPPGGVDILSWKSYDTNEAAWITAEFTCTLSEIEA